MCLNSVGVSFWKYVNAICSELKFPENLIHVSTTDIVHFYHTTKLLPRCRGAVTILGKRKSIGHIMAFENSIIYDSFCPDKKRLLPQILKYYKRIWGMPVNVVKVGIFGKENFLRDSN